MSRNYYAKQAVGKDIKDATGEVIGQVDDMVISPEGNVEFIVVSYDGIFGTTFADKLAAVPYDQCGWDEADDAVTLSISKAQLKNSPTFDKDNIPESGASYFSDVHNHYRNTSAAA